ncbi:hypothetical protein cypCar_00037975 [Cyprinus carpio]|nr:hypothetical protein cypCar_00037975 [Cyprinus carpio]
MNLKRSSSFGGLTSLSMDTLPTYITDAARKRSMAVRQADLERMKDYQRELKEIKTRVTARPHLSEQVSQKNGKNNVECRYRNTLEQAGLDENFVRSKGETYLAIHVDNDCAEEDHYSTESDI